MSFLPQEETPLLCSNVDPNAVYKRFSDPQKKAIVILISWVGLLPSMYTGPARIPLKLCSSCVWHIHTLDPPDCQGP